MKTKSLVRWSWILAYFMIFVAIASSMLGVWTEEEPRFRRLNALVVAAGFVFLVALITAQILRGQSDEKLLVRWEDWAEAHEHTASVLKPVASALLVAGVLLAITSLASWVDTTFIER